MPGKDSNSCLASATESGRSVSTLMVSLWQLETGMRMQVGQT